MNQQSGERRRHALHNVANYAFDVEMKSNGTEEEPEEHMEVFEQYYERFEQALKTEADVERAFGVGSGEEAIALLNELESK